MTEFSISVIALIVSTASASLALCGLMWQIALYRLSGPRIFVRLRPAKIDSNNALLEGADEGWKIIPEIKYFKKPRWSVDLAEVIVTNTGRTAVSVSDISLEIKGGTTRRIGRQHTISGHPVKVHDGIKKNSARLETGESIRIFFDLWAMIGDPDIRKKTLKIRAIATPAGKKAKLSSKRNRWTIRPDQRALDPRDDVTPDVRAYQALWRGLHQRDQLERLNTAWTELQIMKRKYPEKWDFKSIGEKLHSLNIEWPGLIGRDVIDAYNHDPSSEKKKDLIEEVDLPTTPEAGDSVGQNPREDESKKESAPDEHPSK